MQARHTHKRTHTHTHTHTYILQDSHTLAGYIHTYLNLVCAHTHTHNALNPHPHAPLWEVVATSKLVIVLSVVTAVAEAVDDESLAGCVVLAANEVLEAALARTAVLAAAIWRETHTHTHTHTQARPIAELSGYGSPNLGTKRR